LNMLYARHRLACGGQSHLTYAANNFQDCAAARREIVMGDMVKRILVADDHGSTRRSLRTAISQRPDLHVCAEAVDGMDAVEKAKSISPDLVVLDLAMDGLNGMEAAAKILASCPAVLILTISMYDATAIFDRLKSTGVKGFISKNQLGIELLPAIDAVLAGLTWFPTHTESPDSARHSQLRGA
jgi:DNA-binding NarL/FixJ family response regulator